jgi:hypothetical protein
MKMMGKYESPRLIGGTNLFPTVELLNGQIEAANFPHFFKALVSFGTFSCAKKSTERFLASKKAGKLIKIFYS